MSKSYMEEVIGCLWYIMAHIWLLIAVMTKERALIYVGIMVFALGSMRMFRSILMGLDKKIND